MANYDIYAPFLSSWEGGYSNNQNDKGGPTNKGVTFATYTAYCQKKGVTPTLSGLRALSEADWKSIMRGGYWDAVHADGIHDQGVANLIADWAVNSGVNSATKHVQRLVGAKVDGIFGQKTLDAVNAANPGTLFVNLRAARLEYYQSIVRNGPSKATFLAGWTNRTKSIRYTSLTCNDKKHTVITW